MEFLVSDETETKRLFAGVDRKQRINEVNPQMQKNQMQAAQAQQEMAAAGGGAGAPPEQGVTATMGAQNV